MMTLTLTKSGDDPDNERVLFVAHTTDGSMLLARGIRIGRPRRWWLTLTLREIHLHSCAWGICVHTWGYRRFPPEPAS